MLRPPTPVRLPPRREGPSLPQRRTHSPRSAGTIPAEGKPAAHTPPPRSRSCDLEAARRPVRFRGPPSRKHIGRLFISREREYSDRTDSTPSPFTGRTDRTPKILDHGSGRNSRGGKNCGTTRGGSENNFQRDPHHGNRPSTRKHPKGNIALHRPSRPLQSPSPSGPLALGSFGAPLGPLSAQGPSERPASHLNWETGLPKAIIGRRPPQAGGTGFEAFRKVTPGSTASTSQEPMHSPHHRRRRRTKKRRYTGDTL